MFYRIFSILLALFLLGGCASQKLNHKVGDYQNNLNSGISFLSRYEIMYNVIHNGKEIIHVLPFSSNSNHYLPEQIIKLHLGLMIDNPNQIYFQLWIEARFTEEDTGNLFQTTKLVYGTQLLPNEFISIPLPINAKPETQIQFWVKAVSKEGDVLYKSSIAKYKIGKQKNNS